MDGSRNIAGEAACLCRAGLGALPPFPSGFVLKEMQSELTLSPIDIVQDWTEPVESHYIALYRTIRCASANCQSIFVSKAGNWQVSIIFVDPTAGFKFARNESEKPNARGGT